MEFSRKGSLPEGCKVRAVAINFCLVLHADCGDHDEQSSAVTVTP